MAVKRFSFCFIIFVAVLGSIECNRDRIYSKLLDEFDKNLLGEFRKKGVSEEVVKLLSEEAARLMDKEGTELKTIQKQSELTSSLIIICLHILKECHLRNAALFKRVNNVRETLRNLQEFGLKQLGYDLKIKENKHIEYNVLEFEQNIDSFMAKTKNGIEKRPDGKVDLKKTHDDLISLFGEGIQLALSFQKPKLTDTQKLEIFYERIMEISHQFVRIEPEIGYNYMLSLENAFNVFLDVFDRKKLEELRAIFGRAILNLKRSSATHAELSDAYLRASEHVQRMGPSKRNEHITYLKDNYNDLIKKCESNPEACQKIKLGHEYVKKFEGWQFERFTRSWRDTILV